MIRLISLLAVIVVLNGCGGGNDSNTTSRSGDEPAATVSDKGIGPVSDVVLAPIDTAKAAQGAQIFETKCAVCHKFEERYVGPALAGVTDRRKPEWILNMILNPDQMIKEDPQAKALFAQYLTPMTFQNVTREDAELILEHFRAHDSGQ